jgi:hypothetical protein
MLRCVKPLAMLVSFMLLAGCGGTPASQKKPTPSPSPTSQRATGPGVSLEVPQGWVVDTSAAFAAAHFTASSEPVLGLVDLYSSANQIGIFRQTFASIASDFGHTPNLDQITRVALASVARNRQCPAQAPQPTARQVAGTEAEYGDIDCPPSRLRVLVTIHQPHVYVAILLSKTTAFDVNATTFDTAVTSWKWT